MADHNIIISKKSTQEIPYGYCYCGCGQKTNINKFNDDPRGIIKGEPKKYIHGHSKRGTGHDHIIPWWDRNAPIYPIGTCQCGCEKKTTISKVSDNLYGYIKGKPYQYAIGHTRNSSRVNDKRYRKIRIFNHAKADRNGYVREHIVRAEKAYGGPLPKRAVIHHADGSRIGGPLVICENTAYHLFLHQRINALKACGHTNWHKCVVCKKYDSPENIQTYVTKGGNQRHYHLSCKRKYETIGRHRRNPHIICRGPRK